MSEDSEASNNSSGDGKRGLLQQIQEAKHTSNNTAEFIVTAFGIISVTVGCTILMIILLVYPIILVTVGLINLSNCPVNRLIPNLMVLIGVLILFSNVALMTRKCCHPKCVTFFSCLQLPANFFLLVFTFSSAYYICSTIGHVDTTNKTIVLNHRTVLNPHYCDALTFWLAAATVTLILLLLVVAIISSVVACCCLDRLKLSGDRETEPIVNDQDNREEETDRQD